MTESKTFRLGDQELAALERLAHERELSQTDVIREALARFLAAHDRERRLQRNRSVLAMRTFALLERDLGGALPDGPQTYHADGDDVVITVGGLEFRLVSGGEPAEWKVARVEGTEYAEGVIQDGEIQWTRQIRRGDDQS